MATERIAYSCRSGGPSGCIVAASRTWAVPSCPSGSSGRRASGRGGGALEVAVGHGVRPAPRARASRAVRRRRRSRSGPPGRRGERPRGRACPGDAGDRPRVPRRRPSRPARSGPRCRSARAYPRRSGPRPAPDPGVVTEPPVDLPVRASQSRAVRSSLPVMATFPSRLKATARMSSS